MLKINVGDYVRMSYGISRVTNIYERADGNMVFDTENNYQNYFTELRKSSPNIIDLIQVGDYVNGSPVCLIKEDEHNKKWIYTDSNYKVGILSNEIENIVTKEQFESIQYNLENKGE